MDFNATCGLSRLSIRQDANLPAPYINFNIALLVISLTYTTLSVVAFTYYRHYFVTLRKRSFLLLIVAYLGNLCYLALGPVKDLVGWERFSCDLDLWLRAIGGKCGSVSLLSS